LFVGYGTAYLASDDVRYLTRAGFEETRILQSRRDIPDVVRDPSPPEGVRDLLTLVLGARAFADTLGLAAGKTYTTYAEVDRDTLLLVMSAAPENCLCPYTWKFPIVGRVPYKGYFDFAMAHRAAATLEAEGYDTYLRPSAAFSTLGWFNDPLLSTALSRDSVELEALVFHEITQNTVFIPSAVPFNEGFAQMVGYQAAAEFFDRRGDATLARRARDRWSDEVAYSAYFDQLSTRLDRLYGREPPPDSSALAAGRDSVGQWAGTFLADSVGPRLLTYRVEGRAPQVINNARIISRRVYRTRLHLFQAWLERYGDVTSAVAAMRTLMQDVPGDRAYDVLAEALAAPAD